MAKRKTIERKTIERKTVERKTVKRNIVLLSTLLLGVGCGPESSEQSASAQTETAPQQQAVTKAPSKDSGNPGRQAFFGDLHVHTKYSFDAYIFGTRATPDDAYRFARGESLKHAAGIDMKLKAPLDFIAVTDHATYLGMLEKMDDPSSAVGEHPLSIAMRLARTTDERDAVFQEILPRERGFVDSDDLLDLSIVRTAWAEVNAAAERHNDPGNLTTFVGYEFTAGGRRGQNLHRNVIFADGQTPEMPFSRLDADNNPELLWQWMDDIRSDGIDSVAIPHNSNGSDGWMFEVTDKSGQPIDSEYAARRLRNEPLVEVTQVKGTSDTHPLLSPNDEWADFEIMNKTIGSSFPSQPKGSYVREAYLNGLQMQSDDGFNPYKFGLIGASDTHNAAGSFREDDYWSKTGLLDATAELRGTIPLPDGSYNETPRTMWGASGLAGVWAEENTRASIFAAFKRKETFATSGPRMRVRFFAGFDLPEQALGDLAIAYEKGVAMGGDLQAQGGAEPSFLVWAMQDPLTAKLDRVQVIKGWVTAEGTQEQVFDAVCSSGVPDPVTHRCPENGATVDLETCAVAEGEGAADLQGAWRDPTYQPDQLAFYYVRVLQNPVCRWSTWDALRAGVSPRPGLAETIQDRAWSSPIWHVPEL